MFRSARRLRSVTLLAAVALAVAVAAGAAAPPSHATIFRLLTTYPVSVDVDLQITERTSWKGIRPGCFAPAENFSMVYEVDVNSRPHGKASRIKNGAVTLVPGLAGATPSYGAPGGFRQFSTAAPWELQVANPANCPPANALPSGISSPTCKRIAERVVASLQQEGDGPDGRLTITRSPRAAQTLKAGSIGPGCLRALRDADPVGLASEFVLSLRSTLITVPVRSLRSKLTALAEGSDDARPSFRLPITVSGDCTAMRMSGSIGDKPGFTKSPFAEPNQAIGNPVDLERDATCTLSGRGDVTVRREGPPRLTDLPRGVKLP